MSEKSIAKSIAQKLMIKPGRRFLVVNPSPGYADTLGDLPEGVVILKDPGEAADVVQVFVDNRAELEEQLPRLKAHLAPNGMLWVTYHKRSSKIKTDINRDSINSYAHSIGMEGVSMISIDEDWSALRLKVS